MNAASRTLLLCSLLACPWLSARPAITVPLHIGTTNAIVDERGQTLPGTSPAAAIFGHPVVAGDLVQILRSYNGVIDAPGTNGAPAGTNNVVIASSSIGSGVDPAVGQTGQFGMSLADYDGGIVFARVFNAASLAGASFYADSQTYQPGAGYSVFIPSLNTVQPLDGNDDDADGLVNSWEKSLNTNPNNADTDGDRVSDYHEFLSGTDGNDAGDFLRMVQVMPVLNGHSIVFWASVSGKTYQVQFSADLATQAFADLGGPVTATGTTTQIIHTNGLAAPGGHYRVKIMP